jgi:hypothetical protein
VAAAAAALRAPPALEAAALVALSFALARALAAANAAFATSLLSLYVPRG